MKTAPISEAALQPERGGITRRLHLEGPDGPLTCYATLNRDDTGALAELIICANKQGTMEHGLLHCVGLLASLALQNGVPAERIIAALRGVEFEPNGLTGTKDIPIVRSVSDYLAKWMEAHVTVQA
jgi:hypothetical protein